jgi:hypothetical protein
MRILNMPSKLFYHVCKQNDNAKHLVTQFAEALGVGRVLGAHVPTELVRIAALQESDAIGRFFSLLLYCDTNMGHPLRFLSTFCMKKDRHKAWFIRKMPGVRIKQN